MNKAFVYKGLMVVSFFLFLFGLLIANNSLKVLSKIEDYESVKVKIDTISSTTSGSRRGGQTIFAHFNFENETRKVCINCDGVHHSKFNLGDTIEVWGTRQNHIFYLKELYPSKLDLKDHYLFSLFIAPAGIMIYPFLIFTFLFFRERRREKNKKTEGR